MSSIFNYIVHSSLFPVSQIFLLTVSGFSLVSVKAVQILSLRLKVNAAVRG